MKVMIFLFLINLSNMLFYTTLFVSTTAVISSNSWIIMWMALEVNLMSFIPMMNKTKTPYESEASMKYFIVQAMASSMLLISIVMSGLVVEPQWWESYLLMCSLFMKMGAAPLHFWLPGVMQGINWSNCMILMIWQKIAPMVMVSYQLTSSTMSSMIIIASLMVGSVGGLDQTSLRKMMAYSSINHLGWMLAAMLMSSMYWLMYFTLYTVLTLTVIIMLSNNNIYQMTQIYSIKNKSMVKFSLFTSILSMGGLPPFLGFLPKWIIIQNMIYNQSFMMMLIMIMSTLLVLYFYMRMVYSAYMFNSQNQKWGIKITENNFMGPIIISMMGIPMITYLNLY